MIKDFGINKIYHSTNSDILNVIKPNQVEINDFKLTDAQINFIKESGDKKSIKRKKKKNQSKGKKKKTRNEKLIG